MLKRAADLISEVGDRTGQLLEAQTDAESSNIHAQLQGKVIEIQWRMQEETQKLSALMQQPLVSETDALAQVEKQQERLVQRFSAAVSPPGEVRAGWLVLAELAARLAGGEPFAGAEAVFAALAEECAAFRGLSYSALGSDGRPAASAAT